MWFRLLENSFWFPIPCAAFPPCPSLHHQRYHSMATSSFIWVLLSGPILYPRSRSSCLNELRKDPMCTQPQCPPFWEVEGQERRDGDSRASMHQCSQSRRIETLATKASDPRLCPRLFLWRAGIRSQLNWVHLQKQQAGNCYTAVSNITSFLILVTRKPTPLPSKAK